jgi:hypothetical protein
MIAITIVATSKKREEEMTTGYTNRISLGSNGNRRISKTQSVQTKEWMDKDVVETFCVGKLLGFTPMQLRVQRNNYHNQKPNGIRQHH